MAKLVVLKPKSALTSKKSWGGLGDLMTDVRSVMGKFDEGGFDPETARIYVSFFRVGMAGFALSLQFARLTRSLEKGATNIKWFTTT